MLWRTATGRGSWVVRLSVMICVPLVGAARGGPDPAPRSVWESVYSEAQAKRGEAAYAIACASCHGKELAGKDDVAPLAGPAFLANWNGLSVGNLYSKIRETMPPDNPDSLKAGQVADVIAYVLSYSKFPAGKVDLVSDVAVLKQIVILGRKP